MANMLSKQQKRAVIATKIHVAMDLLEKASTILDMAWSEYAAERSLLYCSEATDQARREMASILVMTDTLRGEYVQEEQSAARPK